MQWRKLQSIKVSHERVVLGWLEEAARISDVVEKLREPDPQNSLTKYSEFINTLGLAELKEHGAKAKVLVDVHGQGITKALTENMST